MDKVFLLVFTFFVACLNAQNQPDQPAVGYGGVAGAFNQIITVNCDDGTTGFMLYIPDAPHADSLPLIVFNHGYGEWNPRCVMVVG